MKNKLRSLIYRDAGNRSYIPLIELVIASKWRVSLFLFILPILFLIVFFYLTLLENLFFLIGFLLNYYFTLFVLVLIFLKSISPEKKARSPFYFIRDLNTTYNKNHQDKYKQPLKHLIGAEVGVLRGENAKEILNFLNIEQLILVDTWKDYVDYLSGGTETGLEKNYEEVKNKFSSNDKVKIIRDYSVNAANIFKDEYFDFIYLDADHSYNEVKKDLDIWFPKLKKFGVMCGDDYGHPSGVGVIQAVTQFAFEHELLVHHGEGKQFWFVKV